MSMPVPTEKWLLDLRVTGPDRDDFYVAEVRLLNVTFTRTSRNKNAAIGYALEELADRLINEKRPHSEACALQGPFSGDCWCTVTNGAYCGKMDWE